MAELTSRWKPINQYMDLIGIGDRYRNQEAFDTFIHDFGWKEYMFQPVVMDFKKLLDGDSDYNCIKKDAIGFARLPDVSFEQLGGHNRVFRNDKAVMLVSIFRRLNLDKVTQWCDDHQCVGVICDSNVSFIDNGNAVPVFFMSAGTYDLYESVLQNYMIPNDMYDDI